MDPQSFYAYAYELAFSQNILGPFPDFKAQNAVILQKTLIFVQILSFQFSVLILKKFKKEYLKMFKLTFVQMKMQFETPPVQFVQYLNGQMQLFPLVLWALIEYHVSTSTQFPL